LDSWRWTFTHPCSQAALFTTAKIWTQANVHQQVNWSTKCGISIE
jgi:hypothetical protein